VNAWVTQEVASKVRLKKAFLSSWTVQEREEGRKMVFYRKKRGGVTKITTGETLE